MKKIIKSISRVLFSLLLIVSIFGVLNVFAADVIFQITGVSVKEKSDKVTVNDVSLSGGNINNDIVFTEQGDYITYDITIKNVTEDDYTIKSITDDNDSNYLEYTYDDLANVKVNKGEAKTFNLTITYKEETSDLTITDKAVSLTLTYENEDGTTETETITTNNTKITNPKTGDNITLYILLGLISVTGLVITTVSKKHLSKSLMVIALLSSITLPIGVKADSNKFIIKFNNTISKARPDGGLYDANDNLVISYNDFVTATGWDVTHTDYVYVYDNYSDQEMCMNLSSGPSENISDCSKFLTYILSKNSEYSNVKKVVLPEGVTSIGDYAFFSANLTSIVMPNTLTNIGAGSFSGNLMTEIDIPDSVTTIGSMAFDGTYIPVINVPSSVTSIGELAFDYIPVVLYDGAAVDNGDHWGAFYKNIYVDGEFGYSDSTKKDLLIYIGSSSSAVVPEGVNIIEEGAFSRCGYSDGRVVVNGFRMRECSSLTSVSLPSTLTTIRRNAFYEADGITSLTIPANVTRIEKEIVSNSSTLSTVTFENPSGWFVQYEGPTPPASLPAAVSEEDLSDTVIAAKHLKTNHRYQLWTKE